MGFAYEWKNIMDGEIKVVVTFNDRTKITVDFRELKSTMESLKKTIEEAGSKGVYDEETEDELSTIENFAMFERGDES